MTLFDLLLLSRIPRSIEGVLLGKGLILLYCTKFKTLVMQIRLMVTVLLFQSSVRGCLPLQTKTCCFLEHGLHFYAFYQYHFFYLTELGIAVWATTTIETYFVTSG